MERTWTLESNTWAWIPALLLIGSGVNLGMLSPLSLSFLIYNARIVAVSLKVGLLQSLNEINDMCKVTERGQYTFISSV